MADFQAVRKGGRGNNTVATAPTSKYPTQYQQLLEMGFESKRVYNVLEKTHGDLEQATILLLGDEDETEEDDFTEKKSDSKHAKQNKPTKSTTTATTTATTTHKSSQKSSTTPSTSNTSLPSKNSKEITEQHRKMMASYKVHRCKEISNLSHDRKMCTYWHTSTDRRRNPFEFNYSCYECPNVIGGAECEDGDKCPHAHNMLERMFHPELFKISMCKRTLDGKKCDRTSICAFAHSDADFRVSPSKLDPSLVNTPPTKPVTSDVVIPDTVKENVLTLIQEAGAEGLYSLDLYKKYSQRFNEALEFSEDRYSAKLKLKEFLESHDKITLVYSRGNQPVYVIPDPNAAPVESNESSDLKTVGDRLAHIIKSSGPEGILGSDLPKKYLENHKERLDATDETGAKIKLKELLAGHTAIVLRSVKSQPRYFYEESAEVAAPVVETKPKVPSYAEKAKAAAAASAAKAAAAQAPAPTPAQAAAAPAPVPVAPTPSEAAGTAAPAPAPAAKKEEVQAPAPTATKAPAVPSGKSYASIAAAAKKPVEVPAPAPVVAAPEPVKEAEPVVETVAVQEEVAPAPEPVEETPAVEAIPEPVPEVVAPVVEPTPEPVVLPVGSSAPSSSDPVFPFTMDKKTVDTFASDLSTTTLPVSSNNDLNDLIFSINAPTFGTYNVPLTPEREFKRSSDSLLPPGLTKHQKSGDISSKVDGSDDLARKYLQAQGLANSLQEQLNNLQLELSNRKSEVDSQASQIKSLQQKLSEAESKPSGNDEQLKLQLKQKEEEVAHAAMLNHRYDEEIRRIQQERLTELHHFFSLFQQMEGVLINCKTDMPAEQATPDEVRTILNFIGNLRNYTTGAKGQAKYKYDLVQRQAATTHPSAAYMFEPYSLANGARYSGYGGVAVNPYDQSSYFAQSGILGGADPSRSFVGNYGQNYGQQQCAFPGCRSAGQFKCTRCMNVSYCSSEHQQ